MIIAIESIHGILRAVFLTPSVGDFRARQIGVFIGSLLIFAVAYALVPWIHAINRRALIGIGLLWVGLTLLFEFSVGHFVVGSSWTKLTADYDIANGGLLAIGMIWLALSPLVVARLREVKVGARGGN